MLDMLQGRKNLAALHEFRHGVFRVRRERGERSVYMHWLEARRGRARRNLGGGRIRGWDGIYSQMIALDEIYTHALDLSRLSSSLRKIPASESAARAAYEAEIRLSIGVFEDVIRSVRGVMDGIRTDRPGSWAYDSREGVLSIPDAHGRFLKVLLTVDTREKIAGGGISRTEYASLLSREARDAVARISGLMDRVSAQMARVRRSRSWFRRDGNFHDEISALSRIVREEGRR